MPLPVLYLPEGAGMLSPSLAERRSDVSNEGLHLAG
jgi:hypothetical protein